MMMMMINCTYKFHLLLILSLILILGHDVRQNGESPVPQHLAILPLANNSALAEVLPLANNSALAEVLPLANNSALAEVLPLANNTALAEVLPLANNTALAEVLLVLIFKLIFGQFLQKGGNFETQ
jgi:hypothetical protein